VLHYFRNATYHSEFVAYPMLQANVLALLVPLYLLGGRLLGVWTTPQAFASLLDPRRFMPLADGLSVVFGLGAIYVTYLLGRRLAGRRAGLLAALLLALTPTFNRYAHEGVPDAALTFFAALATLALVVLVMEPTRRHYVWAGVALGLATAAKYNGAMWAVVALLAHVWLWRQRRAPLRELVSANLLLAGLAGLAAFAVTSPQVLLEPRTFMHSVLVYETDYKLQAYAGGVNPATFVPWLTAVWVFLRSEHGIALMFAAGLVYALIRRTPARWFLLIGVLLAWAYMGRWRMVNMRFYLLIYPALAALAATAVVEMGERLARKVPVRRWQAALPAVVCLGLVVWTGWAYAPGALALLRPDTRDLSRVWIESNLPRGAAVAGPQSPEGYPALLAVSDLDDYLHARGLPRRLRAPVSALLARWPAFDLRSLYYGSPNLVFPAEWPAAVRARYTRSMWARREVRQYASLDRLRADKVQYVVTSGYWAQDFLAHSSPQEIQPYDARELYFQTFRKLYLQLEAIPVGGEQGGIRCLREFLPQPGAVGGPAIRIYELAAAPQPSPSQSPPS